MTLNQALIEVNLVDQNLAQLTDKEIRKTYLKLAKKYHPDVAKTGDKVKF